ncbi:hypothetical protein STRIP9103_03820 [Streptomyces ipomoeae 91-03]|uniref:Uncharacterized protein n=1 Tax=Streptomyces ipomoeae 91-03 TaxID=698759 RepID=L1KZ98_9ACTN|nr:hypothetical protein STRIP9103_03820 [Streptomyces ipomoeae 91-03]
MPGGIFDNMSHEQMLQWLDQANSGTVQAAADRLAAAAKEIHKIADELKVRPQRVEWKGEGADAFRTWTADLANSTLRLGDFSESSAKWLAQASDAIARAQAAIPRTAEGAEANLVAAASAPNDPDADTISKKSSDELAALAVNKEKVRQEAADEMIKLGQAYEFSAVQLNALERPKFPPPPEAVLPPNRDSSRDSPVYVPDSSAQGSASGGEGGVLDTPQSRDAVTDTSDDVRRSLGTSPRERVEMTEDRPPTRMGIDSVETLPDKQTATPPVGGPPSGGRVEGSGTTPQTNLIPSVPGGNPRSPVGGPPAQGRVTATGRVPQMPSPTGPSPNPSRVPGGTGIIGGRPVTPPLGGQTGAVHRGTVVGTPSAGGRSPIGPATGASANSGRMIGQQGQTPGRSGAPGAGVIGGTPHRMGRAGLGPGGSGGTAGSGAISGGTTRGGVIGGASSTARTNESGGMHAPRGSRRTSSNTDNRREQQSRSAEDEEARRQRNSRTVPPVID